MVFQIFNFVLASSYHLSEMWSFLIDLWFWFFALKTVVIYFDLYSALLQKLKRLLFITSYSTGITIWTPRVLSLQALHMRVVLFTAFKLENWSKDLSRDQRLRPKLCEYMQNTYNLIQKTCWRSRSPLLKGKQYIFLFWSSR